MIYSREWYLDAFEEMRKDPENSNYAFDPNLDYNAMSTAQLDDLWGDYLENAVEFSFAEENARYAARDAAICASSNVVKIY